MYEPFTLVPIKKKRQYFKAQQIKIRSNLNLINSIF